MFSTGKTHPACAGSARGRRDDRAAGLLSIKVNKWFAKKVNRLALVLATVSQPMREGWRLDGRDHNFFDR
jgi:hypothetical protein